MKSFSAVFEAILLMLAGMASFSAMNTVIRLLSSELPSTEMALLRNICSLIIVVSWETARSRGKPRFPTKRLIGHFWRATFGVCAMELWFHSLALMKLTLATAISFMTPIFSAIIAIIFLGERAGWHRWAAIAAGFVGMLIILRPGTGDVGFAAIFVLGSSIMMGIAGVMVKSLSSTEKPETIVFYMALFMIPWSILPAIPYWQPFTTHQFGLIFLIGIFSTFAHLLIARAYIRADLTMLMPFDFTRLIFTAGMAYALFGETLDAPTILGSLVIVTSSVYIAHREARARRLSARTP